MSNPERSEITSWLQRNCLRIASLTAVDDFSDLESLKTLLADTRVIAFGDPTHGTHEFYRLRARLLKFLVSELDCRALAIECSISAAEPINQFIAGRRGELPTLITELKSAMWDVEEFVEILVWLEQYNRSVPDRDKVSFIGFDIWNTAPARQNVLQFLKTVAPSETDWVGEFFDVIATGESQGIAAAHNTMPDSLLEQSARLLGLVAEHRTEWGARTSRAQLEQVSRDAEAIWKWVAANKSELVKDAIPARVPRVPGFNGYFRSTCMAAHLFQSCESLEAQAKIVIWAHSYHVGAGIFDERHGFVSNMGTLLQERWGDQYYAFLFECNQGRYLARTMRPDKTLGQFMIGGIPPAPENSLPWYLAQVGNAPYLVNLRRPELSATIDAWLTESRVVHATGWACSDPPHLYTHIGIKNYCDGLIFIESTSPTTPSPNARRAVAESRTY